ncbi:MAG TPA: hypothetical protein VNM72_02135 [Blastocatellia bacterium]|nr:hypothetical protein [Blastocatellia bacterium]
MVGNRTLETTQFSLDLRMTMIEMPNAICPRHDGRVNPDGTFRFGGLPPGKFRP